MYECDEKKLSEQISLLRKMSWIRPSFIFYRWSWLNSVVFILTLCLCGHGWGKELKPRQSAYELANLIKQVYELKKITEATDQIKRVIRDGLDQQASASYLPLDVIGAIPKTKIRPLIEVISDLWIDRRKNAGSKHNISQRYERTVGVMTHDHLDAFLQELMSRSRKSSKRFRTIKEHITVSKVKRLRNGTGLLETSYSLALENMVRLPKRLKRWRKKYNTQVNDTIDLFKQSLKYLDKLHRRGERVSGEQFGLIQLSLGTCYLALEDFKNAKKHFRLFFRVPSPGESILLLQGMITDLSAPTPEPASEIDKAPSSHTTSVEPSEERSGDLEEEEEEEEEEYYSTTSDKYSGILKGLRHWSRLLNGERKRIRRLKSKTRDALKRTKKMKRWWKKEINKTRNSLGKSESTLAIEQLLTVLMLTAQTSQVMALGDHPIQWIKIPSGTMWVPAEDQSDGIGKNIEFEAEFWISRSEVTVAQYQACVDEGVCTAPHWHLCANKRNGDFVSSQLPNSFQAPNRPIVCIDWHQARKFSRWVGGDLPTETEWMYVAQGAGQGLPYPWGFEKPSCERAIYRDNNGAGCGYKRTWDVCVRPLGRSPQGVCDIAGNVWEWVLDSGIVSRRKLILPIYQKNGEPTCTLEQCSGPNVLRISRGGGWGSGEALLSTKARAAFKGKERHPNLGFRPVLRSH